MLKKRQNSGKPGGPNTGPRGPLEAIWDWVKKLPRPLRFARR